MKRSRQLWTAEEEKALLELHDELGSSWNEISQREPFANKRSASQLASKYSRLKTKEGKERKESKGNGNTVVEEKEEEKADQKGKKKKISDTTKETSTSGKGEEISTSKDIFDLGVPENRREEILEFLQLFGYQPQSTILQFHIPGKFGVSGGPPKKAREEAKKRYGGTTFVVIGRTHDLSLKDQLKPPASQGVGESYVGYLWSGAQGKPPHEILPLDFTPSAMHYPDEWNEHFGTDALLVCMHVASDFAVGKNLLNRMLSKEVRKLNVKEPWTWLESVKDVSYQSKLKEKPQQQPAA